jgi:hypothetical protein
MPVARSRSKFHWRARGEIEFQAARIHSRIGVDVSALTDVARESTGDG